MSWELIDDLPEETHPIEGHECVYEHWSCIICGEPEEES